MAKSAEHAEAAEQQRQNPPRSKEARKGIMIYAKPYRKAFTGVFFCTLIAVFADLLQPYLVKIVIDDHLMQGKTEFRPLLLIGVLYLLLSILALLFSYLQNNLIQRTGQGIVASLRKDLFRHISRLSPSFFDRTSSGSLVTHVSSDTETVSQFFTQVLMSLMRDGMTLLLIIVLMFQLDPVLASYSMVLLPVIGIIAFSFRSYMRKTYQLSRSRLSRLIAFTAENLSGMNLVQAFHQEKEQERQFAEKNETYFEANLREIRTNVLFNRSFDLLGNLSVAFIAWLGGRAVLGESLEFGILYAFITYIRQFFQPINAITQQWNTLQSASVSMDRIWGLLSTKPELPDDGDASFPALNGAGSPQVSGAIDFRNVTFGYGDGEPVIKGLSLSIRPGERIGIVGTTGAGKSSLISLLCRFYDVRKGSVQIDGIDVRKLPLATLSRTVGLVQQEPYLFSGSIIDNIRLFDTRFSPEQAMQACKFVGADALIRRLPDGYDTMLSEKGSGLSTGERQLLSFARIVLYQPAILVLDEATANLDSSTEQLVQRALDAVAAGRTTLVIAHRISTVMDADRIIVMRSGVIAEQGSHEELVRQRGYYEQLFRHSQGRPEERGAG
ncbi:ABC transporter ATP-binding protein [Paenibacillus sp. RUD330]|uniref:ABC transporter ATP-binding protein n=1 Tax=Paenibacillus sp. RUD330 TaxID=2023772 RepID=UPI000B92B694|nr:ABC transporter ATP-binding protein [Paenibacillus sp. RUD330]ASS65295.1 ABC transporter ATP-binding protein [Paenibacillus sp. RUD330]